jgi:hypothetical protein
MSILIAKIKHARQLKSGFEPIVDWLKGAGLTLVNPTQNAITRFTDDGEQITVNEEDIRNSLRDYGVGSLQLWFDITTDLYIGWNKDFLTIFFDGKTAEQKRTVISTLVQEFIESRDEFREWTFCLEYE